MDPHMCDLAALLAQCSDMVLRCTDGRCIPCSRFHLVSTCEVIRNVMDDAIVEKDGQGRYIIPFPNVDSTDLALAVDVLHGIRPVHSLPGHATPAALRGLEALGHSAGKLVTQLREHLWMVVQGGSFVDIQPHINEFVHLSSIRSAVLRALVTLCPHWRDFKAKVLGYIDMDFTLAVQLIPLLSRFFPAGPLFCAILDRLPTNVMTATKAITLFTAPNNATSYHPEEAIDAIEALAAKFERGEWDGVLLDFFKGVLAASRVYDVAPHVANNMHGSIVILENRPYTSCLLSIFDRKGLVVRKMASWLTLDINWATGFVNARILMHKLDDSRRPARNCQLRLTAYTGTGVAAESAEVWYSFVNLNPYMTYTILDNSRAVGGCLDAFQAAVKSARRLRVDAFYGADNILEKPFF